MHTTSRLTLDVVDSSDAVSSYPTVDSQAKTILDNAVTFASNTLVNLSASLAGRLLRATDTKQWFADNGSSLDQLLTLGIGPLAATTTSTSITAAAGQLVLASAAGITITLPSPSANAFVGVVVPATVAVTGASPVTVSGTNLNGVGFGNVSSVPLGAPGAFVLLQSNGVGWFTIAGQQDSGWKALSLPGGFSQASGFYQPAQRLIGDRVFHKGTIASSGTVSPGTTIATGSYSPSGNVAMGGFPSAYIQVSNGSTPLVWEGSTTAGAVNFPLDGLSFTLS